jgi:hypothetical protein
MVKRYASKDAAPPHVTSLATTSRPLLRLLKSIHLKVSPGATRMGSIFACGNCSTKAG